MAKGLIIKPVWLDKMFEQGKCWEMRSSMTKHRGKTYLIASGSGVITGECNIVDAFSPDASSLRNAFPNTSLAQTSYQATPV
jgi:hypothetical protein